MNSDSASDSHHNFRIGWVTGAGRGIGRAIAMELAARDFVVWLTDIDSAGIEATENAILRMGGSCFTRLCDVSVPSQVKDALDAIVAHSGRIDLLVNNAGIVHTDELLELPFETWRRVMSVNADGVFLTSQATARQMIEQSKNIELDRRGLIINIGSRGAEMGRPLRAAYGASKAVVKHLTMSLAVTFRSHAVAATLICPGEVLEGMIREIIEQEARLSGLDAIDVEKAALATIPSGSFQSPADVARLTAFVACTAGMDNSGQVLWCEPFLQPI